ncbi:hypothetical protein D3C87_2200220 [compost metagenome]
MARSIWPQISQLMLSVDPQNHAALHLYLSEGWIDCGNAYQAKAGYERKLVLAL